MASIMSYTYKHFTVFRAIVSKQHRTDMGIYFQMVAHHDVAAVAAAPTAAAAAMSMSGSKLASVRVRERENKAVT